MINMPLAPVVPQQPNVQIPDCGAVSAMRKPPPKRLLLFSSDAAAVAL
jgi:hypothetical protein